MKKTYVFCPKRQKMVEKGTEQRELGPKSAEIMPDIEQFVSPIDGSVITSRSQRNRHMKQHGVTHSSDYSPEFLAQRAKERHQQASGQTTADRNDRIRHLVRALDERR